MSTGGPRAREREGRTLVTGSLLAGPPTGTLSLTGWLGSLRRMIGGLINRGEGGAPRIDRGPTGLNSRGGPLGLANLGLGSPTDFFCSDWKNKEYKITVQLKTLVQLLADNYFNILDGN